MLISATKCPAPILGSSLIATNQLGGAVKKFHCRAGTVLNGTSEIYCDGKNWSGDVPVCVGKTSYKR